MYKEGIHVRNIFSLFSKLCNVCINFTQQVRKLVCYFYAKLCNYKAFTLFCHKFAFVAIYAVFV